MFVELNIDALLGPTHHYGGVGVGNVASQTHTRQPSYPRLGALEGLRKARLVAQLGIPQYVLPPLRRPLTDLLPALGFVGDLASQCVSARSAAPAAYSATFSSAFMWAANAATVAPACDCADGRTHLTLANLSSSWHRMFEHPEREKQLRDMFGRMPVTIHSALPALVPLRDEGAANHMRLSNPAGDQGFHVFVYGESDDREHVPQRFLARQTRAACQAIARLHGLDPSRTFFLQQHPEAIDAGVFHNDVIATSHRQVLLMHERAFLEADSELERLASEFERVTGAPLKIIRISEDQLSLSDAVKSYLFNSQLLTPVDRPEAMVLVCAAQCQRMPQVKLCIDNLIAAQDNPIQDASFVALDQSMSGGGGPACLRLRVQLPADAVAEFAPRYRLTEELAQRLEALIGQHYPERLEWDRLADPENLLRYARTYAAMDQMFGE